MKKKGISGVLILVLGLIIGLAIAGAVGYYLLNKNDVVLQNQTDGGPVNEKPYCGDGICQTLESSGRIPCSKDCGTSGDSPDKNFIKDIAYGSDSSAQKLDLYLPKGVSGKIPVIIEIHGGGFSAGDKYPSTRAEFFNTKGYAVAAINYRLSGEAIFPAAAYDVKSAVRWLRANADKYNLDAANFGAIGGSAGGYFSAFLGTTGDIKDFDVGDNLEYSSVVQAVVDQFGPVNFSSLAQDRVDKGYDPSRVETTYLGCNITLSSCENRFTASPINYVSSNDASFSIIHGAIDDQIPIKQSQDFYNALQSAGVDSQFTTVPNAGHGGPQYNSYNNEYLDFFDKYLK
ncbi:MAG: alpha/beta hydrolase [Nanoarchaeota archaeon]